MDNKDIENPARIWINPTSLMDDLHRENARIFLQKNFKNDVEYARVDPPAAPTECFCGTELEAGICPNGHDEADKMLARKLIHGLGSINKYEDRVDFAITALAQARKEGARGAWEKAIHVVTKVHEHTLGSVSDWQVIGPLESAMKKDLESASKQERGQP